MLKQVADFSEKEILLAEFSWAYTYDNGDDSGNSVSEESAIDKPYSISVQGQVDCIADAMDAIASLGKAGLGVFWWEPAWIPVHGSGWATPASLKYMNDPGPCGNEWANQALFDYDGNVLPALEVIRDFKK